MASHGDHHRPEAPFSPEAQLGTVTLVTTQFILFWETCAPALLKPAGILALYCAVTLFDLWQYVPWPLHYGGVLCFLGGLWLTLAPLLLLTWPTRQQAYHRLEQDAALSHYPLQTLDDACFRGDGALWTAHQHRMAQAALAVKLEKPRACMDKADPYFIRYIVIFVLLLGCAVAWNDIGPRFWRSITPGVTMHPPLQADIWIDPPGYTGASPILLAQNAGLPDIRQGTITVPQNAILFIRLHPPHGAGLRKTAIKRLFPKQTRHDTLPLSTFSNTDTLGLEAIIETDQTIFLHHGGQRVSWSLQTIPDAPPSIRWHKEPATVKKQYLALEGYIDDDYAITNAFARFTLVAEQPRALDVPAFDPQIMQTMLDIPLTGFTGQRGLRQTELDIASHPWAGLQAQIMLVVEDNTGQTARTLPMSITLPASPLYNPLAKAALYERQNLAVAPTQWPITQRALAALTTAPEKYFDSFKDYLLLRSAYWDVTLGQGKNIMHLVKSFWQLALQLEDQDLALARRILTSAQEALYQALAANAPQDVINRLIDDLKQATQNYLQALAASGQSVSEGDVSSQELAAQDLNRMMDKIADFAATGATTTAQRMLNDLKSLLDNMRISQPDGGGQSGQSQAGGQTGGPTAQASTQTLDIAGALIEQQRHLTDRTFTAIRQTHGLTAATDAPQHKNHAGRLEADQRRLTQQLSHMLQSLNDAHIDSPPPLRTAMDAYTKAAHAMRAAERHLAAKQLGDATLSQSEALEALRDGAKSLATALNQEQQADQPTIQNGRMQDGSSDANMTDPLGRAYRGNVGETRSTLDFGDPQAAYELLLELRQRLADPERPQHEIDYLERLLNLQFDTQNSTTLPLRTVE